MRAILSRVFLRNRASSANLTIVLMIVHLSCVYTILFLLSWPQYQLITPCVLTAYGESFFLFRSMSRFEPSIHYHSFFVIIISQCRIIVTFSSNFLASKFSNWRTFSSCDSVSDNHRLLQFSPPNNSINLCQDFQLISSSLKNGTNSRQTRF